MTDDVLQIALWLVWESGSFGSVQASCYGASRTARASRSLTGVGRWPFWRHCPQIPWSGYVPREIFNRSRPAFPTSPSQCHSQRAPNLLRLCWPGSGAMSAEQRVTYIDSSAIVKLVIAEPESKGLRRYISRRQPLVTTALARTEVARALLPIDPEAVARGEEALRRIQLLRVNDRVLRAAGRIEPAELRSLDAIHLASAGVLGPAVRQIVTYDERMADAAHAAGFTVAAPS